MKSGRLAVFGVAATVLLGCVSRVFCEQADIMQRLLPMLSIIPVRIHALPTDKWATGFLMSGVTEGKRSLLVTNKHVFNGALDLEFIIQLGDTAQNLMDTTNLRQPLYGNKHDSLFFVSREFDLGMCIIDDGKVVNKGWQYWAVKTDIFAVSDSLYPSQKVIFLGFPLGLTVNSTQPLVRSGAIAGVDIASGLIFLDAEAFGGSSGSPVFLDCGTQAPRELSECLRSKIFVGIVAGYIPYDKLYRNIETGQIEMKQTENSGLAIVVPPQVILQLGRAFAEHLGISN